MAMTAGRLFATGCGVVVGGFGLAFIDPVPALIRAVLCLPAVLVGLMMIGIGWFHLALGHAHRQETKLRGGWTSEEWDAHRMSIRGQTEARFEREAVIRARGNAARARARQLGVTVGSLESMEAELAQHSTRPEAEVQTPRIRWDGSDASRRQWTVEVGGLWIGGSQVRVAIGSDGGWVYVSAAGTQLVINLGQVLVMGDRADPSTWSVETTDTSLF